MIGLTTTVSTSGLALFSDILKLNPRSLNMAGAQSARVTIIDHLRAYDRANPNKLGGKRQHIANQMADSTRAEATAEEGAVIIAHPFANFFIRGGTVRPGKNPSFISGGPTQALTIPAHSQSHGERAERFRETSTAIYFKVPRGKLLGMIVDKINQRLGRDRVRPEGAITGGRLAESGVFRFRRILYWLVSEATVKGRPDAIPVQVQIVNAALDGMKKWIFRNQPRNA